MMQTSRRDLVDRLTGGHLDEIISGAASYDHAVNILRDEHGIEVSRETLRRWFTAEPTEQAS